MSANTHEYNCGCFDEVQHCQPGKCPYCCCWRLKAERNDERTRILHAVNDYLGGIPAAPWLLNVINERTKT